MSARQFAVFLEAVNAGDGNQCVKPGGTYVITTGNKTFADRVQSLAIRRGWQCTISDGYLEGRIHYRVRLKQKAIRLAHIRIAAPKLNERVWCVTTPFDTAVSRRRGKTGVSGNCMLAAESGGKHGGPYGGFRLLFIPWHTLKRSYAINFDTPRDKKDFGYTLDDKEKSLIALHTTSLEQLNWRRSQLAGPPFNNDEDLFDQEYPTDLETAFLSSGLTVLSRDALKTLVANKRPPKWKGDIYWGRDYKSNQHESDYDLVRRPVVLTPGEARVMVGGTYQRFQCSNNDINYEPLWVYQWPRKGDRIVIACDVGGGNPHTKGGGDPSTIIVARQEVFGPSEVLMAWGGRIAPVEFARLASALAWYVRDRTGDEPAPLLAPEWNGVGVPMNTYIDNRKLYEPHFRYFAPGVRGTPVSNHFGWESNSKTKPLAVGMLIDMIERNDFDIPDSRCVLELSAYKKFLGQQGEDFGGEGAHDDFVCALYIAAACIRMNRIGGEAAPQRLMAAKDPDGRDDGEPFDFSNHSRGTMANDDDSMEYEGGSDAGMDWG